MLTIQNFNFNIVRKKIGKTREEVYCEGNEKNDLNDIKKLKTICISSIKITYHKELIKKKYILSNGKDRYMRLYTKIVLVSATKYLYFSLY